MKRIYVVIQWNEEDAIAQGAFESEKEAHEAMNEWINRHSSYNCNWGVFSTTLHSKDNS